MPTQTSWVLLPSSRCHKPSLSQFIQPRLVLWNKSQMVFGVLKKAPSTCPPVRATAQPQCPGTNQSLAPEAALKPPSDPKPKHALLTEIFDQGKQGGG